MDDTCLDEIKWTADGLVPVIAQDADDGQILMMAWMNKTALLETIDKKQAVYWSRSRQRLWHKGEESGHVQKIVDMRLDCDSDVLLLKVEQIGGIACHTGRRHCFYKQLQTNEQSTQWVNVDPVLKDPKQIYK